MLKWVQKMPVDSIWVCLSDIIFLLFAYWFCWDILILNGIWRCKWRKHCVKLEHWKVLYVHSVERSWLAGPWLRPLFFIAARRGWPDAAVEEAQGEWSCGPGLPDSGWMGLSSAMGTAALLSQPGRRRRRASCAKNQSAFPLVVWLPPRRETASQQRDCPSVFKRGTVRFLRSLIYSWESLIPHTHTLYPNLPIPTIPLTCPATLTNNPTTASALPYPATPETSLKAGHLTRIQNSWAHTGRRGWYLCTPGTTF